MHVDCDGLSWYWPTAQLEQAIVPAPVDGTWPARQPAQAVLAVDAAGDAFPAGHAEHEEEPEEDW